MKAAVVAQLKAREGIGTEEERAAAAAVLSAIDRAQEAAQEAASATGEGRGAGVGKVDWGWGAGHRVGVLPRGSRNGSRGGAVLCQELTRAEHSNGMPVAWM